LDWRNLSLGYVDVNVTGCFVIGIFNTVTGPDGGVLVPAHIRIFVMAGVCGGYTTFSSFGLETVNLVRNGEWFAAEAYILASVLFCLIAVWLGHFAGVLVNR
jgi:CrcB protein